MKRYLIFVSILAVLIPIDCIHAFAAESSSQYTTGSQSPAIKAGGDVFVSYFSGLSYEQLRDVTKILCGALHQEKASMERDANAEADKLRSALMRALAVTEASSDDAVRRAQQFVDTLPARKEKMKLQDEDLQRLNEEAKDRAIEKSRKLQLHLDYLFHYIFSYIDPFAVTLKKEDKIIGFDINEYDALFVKSPKNQVVRRIIFNNRSTIEIHFSQGMLENGLIKAYPSLRFTGTVGKLSQLEFSVGPTGFSGQGIQFVSSTPPGIHIPKITPEKIPSVAYNQDAKELPIEDIKKGFKQSFDKLFEQVFVMDCEQKMFSKPTR